MANQSEVINDVWDSVNHVLKTSANVTGDFAIGAVEIKDAAGTGRAMVLTNGAVLPTPDAGETNGALMVEGFDGTNARWIRTDTIGNTVQVGPAASGAALSGSPVRVGGSDGTSVQNLVTASALPTTGAGILVVAPGIAPVVSLNAVTATGAGTVVDLGVGRSNITMTTLTTGAPTAVTVNLEGSLDNVNWYILVSSASTTGDLQASTGKPVRFIRANLATLTAGTAPTVTARLIAAG